jgi:hypothetical protein
MRMKNEIAAGRKTDPLAGAVTRHRSHLETQLEILTGAMRTSVARADESSVENDEYGHARDSAIGQAVKIGEVSAKIVLALGKLSGEFNHNITVNKGAEHVPAASEPVSRGDYPAHWYDRNVAVSSSHPPLDAALKRWHAEEDEIEAEEAREAALREAQGAAPDGTPPPPSGT